MSRFCLIVLVLANALPTFIYAAEAADAFPPQKPIPYMSVEESQKAFILPDGYRMEIVLDENSIKEPVVCAFDGNGRMYVCEMRTYMQDIDGTGELAPGGRVSRHECTKGDGVFDKHTVFADGLLLPREVLPLDDRVLINETNTNDIYAYRDTKGTGISDSKELFFAGGARGGNLEHQQSGLIWAMDNWMYQAVNAFRLRIKGKEVLKETTPGNGGQWGANQDDYGKMWFVQGGGEIGPLNFQTPIIYGGLNLPDQSPPDYREVWPLVGLADVQGGYDRFRPVNKTLNHFTATCGIDVVRVDRLPEDIRGDVLFGEPVGRLIRRSKVENKDGMTFIRNAYDKKEFLLSSDPNFRPVNIVNGPDGCLYIVDMCRGIIQEGNWTKEGSYLRKVIKQYGLDKNFGRGRIWRLTHKDFQPGPQPHMLDETPAQWVTHLDHPNGWWRDTAQKLIVLRGDKSVIPALVEMALKSNNNLARIHALWTLEGLDALEKDVILAALKDSDANVRVAAIRASEGLLKKGDPALLTVVNGMKTDSDPNVVLQVLLTAKILNAPDFSKFAQVIMAQTKFDGVKKVGNALINNGSSFSAQHYGKEAVPHLEHGGEIFRELCYACHGYDGKGMPREAATANIVLTSLHPGATAASTLAPPLAGSPSVRDRDSMLRVLMSGLGGPIHDKTYDAQMVSMNTNDDEWVADVASFVRNSFGNHGAMVSWMDAARIRAESQSRPTPWTLNELESMQAKPLNNQSEWKLSASHGAETLKYAIDGKIDTKWTTGVEMKPGMWFQVELPSETEIQRVVLDHTRASGDYMRGYRLEMSPDGKAWKMISEGKCPPSMTEILFAPVKTKFLRLTQTGNGKGINWSIGELQLYPPAPKKQPAAASKKLLVVNVNLTERSGSMADAEKLLADLAERVGAFSVDFVKAPGGKAPDTIESATKLLAQKLSLESLKNYDGVIFLNTSGELPLPDKQGFIDWIKGGKAFIGIHGAADTLHDFKPYAEMLGGEVDIQAVERECYC